MLGSEGQVVVLPAGHPLTSRSQLTLAEATDIPGLPAPRRIGRDGTAPDGPGPAVRDQTQLFGLIALGRASVVMAESGRVHLREDLVAIPVVDAPTVTTVIAWPPQSRSAAVAALVRTATQL